MIVFLEGKIKYIGAGWLILDVNGVGYKIQLKIKNLSADRQDLKLKIGEQCELYIYHHIREDRQELYGFKTLKELRMLELLLGVNGVGPKMGMNILSNAEVDKLEKAIIKGDSALLTAISGVGQKLALKILVELKHKLSAGAFSLDDISSDSMEIMDALISLGYKKQEILPIIAKFPAGLASVQDKVKWAIRNLKRS